MPPLWTEHEAVESNGDDVSMIYTAVKNHLGCGIILLSMQANAKCYMSYLFSNKYYFWVFLFCKS